MSRATNAPSRAQRRKKVLKRAKGYFGRRKSSFRLAARQVKRSMAFAYVGRKQKKRDYRGLWNVRINAAARINGTSYSRLIHGLQSHGVEIDRKVLADIALQDPDGFASIVKLAVGQG